MLVPPKTPLYSRVVILALVGVLLCASAASAAPTNSKIRSARARAEAAREKLDDLAADLEERSEDYFEAQADLDATETRIEVAEADLATAMIELDSAEARLNGRAQAIYRSGPVDFVSVVLGATDFRDLVTRLDLMRFVGRSDASLVGEVKQAKARIEKTRSTLERRRAEQLVLRDRAEVSKTKMESAVREQKSYIATVDSELKKLIAQEKERQEELARKRAAEAARLAASGGTGRAGRPFDPDALGPARPRVVDLARRYVGKTPYVWGGVTPEGFDCSGLVLYCYRELGVNLPRTSRQQYLVGAYIPPNRMDLLEPGDLVFFGRDGDPGRVHHVAIYSGGGMMVHAPQTGEMVSETSLLSRIATRGDYVGAVRP